MTRGRQLEAAGYVYATQVVAERPVTDYTVRVVPYFRNAAVPLEAPQILWQRRLQNNRPSVARVPEGRKVCLPTVLTDPFTDTDSSAVATPGPERLNTLK